MSLLEAVNLTCHRGDRALFEGLSACVDAGQVLEVHGPNGGGKTTLLRALSGLTLPTAGRIFWDGRDITRGARFDTERYRAELCFIGHANGVKSELTPIENLRVWQALYESPDDGVLHSALDQVGLVGFEDVLALTLSAGQRRRVALARLLVTGARLWVLDEPFTSLDRDGIKWVETRISQHVKSGGAVIFTSHQAATLGVPVEQLALGIGG